MKRIAFGAIAIGLGLAVDASAQIVCQDTNITVDTTWGDDETEVVLELPIFVKSGATLTILPGTIVRGQPRSGPVIPQQTTGSPGALIVTQEGKIDAQGTPGLPIIFTTAAIDNVNNATGAVVAGGDGIADDVNDNGFEDAYDCGNIGSDAFLDDDPANAPLAPLNKPNPGLDGILGGSGVDDDLGGEANVALWGGLVILGRAPTNLADACPDPGDFGQCTVEGLTVPGFPVEDATYGGIEINDSSGALSYVSVRHAGDELGEGNELNGVTLGGVGAGTQFDHIEVYMNFDDGIEWFGGNVNGSYLHVHGAGDDTFDIDQGYAGVNQFLFGVMPTYNEFKDVAGDGSTSVGTGSGDKGGEWDGDDFDEAPTNANAAGPASIIDLVSPAPMQMSNVIMYNVTIIGSTPDAGADFEPNEACTGVDTPYDCCDGAGTGDCSNSDNRGIQMRNGFAGELNCSVVVNTGSRQGIDISGGGADGFTTGDNIDADYDGDGFGDLVRVQSLTTQDVTAASGADELDALANGDAVTSALGANADGSAGFPGLENEDTTFDPTGNAAGKLVSALKSAPLDPRPGNGTTDVGGCNAASEPGTDPSATYRGAFARSAPALWTSGWTVLSISGLMAD